MTTDLDHLYALADGAIEARQRFDDDQTDRNWSACWLAKDEMWSALSPDVVKGLIERVRKLEGLVERALPYMGNAKWADDARTALEAKDD